MKSAIFNAQTLTTLLARCAQHEFVNVDLTELKDFAVLKEIDAAINLTAERTFTNAIDADALPPQLPARYGPDR